MAKKKWDLIDEEAEKEGESIKEHGKSKPMAVGKRIRKQRQLHRRGEGIVEKKVIKKFF